MPCVFETRNRLRIIKRIPIRARAVGSRGSRYPALSDPHTRPHVAAVRACVVSTCPLAFEWLHLGGGLRQEVGQQWR